jgi:hypothetical protein
MISNVAGAQVLDIISIINTAIKKVIVAADLAIEQKQTETIELQSAEKTAENDMSQSELSDIIGWVQDQKSLFQEYYNELWQVKTALSTYERVKAMIAKQAAIVTGFRQAYANISQDKHFSAAEVAQFSATLSGVVTQSERNITALAQVITALLTQMDDAGRLRLIDQAGSGIDRNYQDLAQFSQETYLLSLQRAQDANDVAVTKALYGIQ